MHSLGGTEGAGEASRWVSQRDGKKPLSSAAFYETQCKDCLKASFTAGQKGDVFLIDDAVRRLQFLEEGVSNDSIRDKIQNLRLFLQQQHDARLWANFSKLQALVEQAFQNKLQTTALQAAAAAAMANQIRQKPAIPKVPKGTASEQLDERRRPREDEPKKKGSSVFSELI